MRWMRQQFGIVGQEPSLFATTIYENIKHGLDSATKEDIEKAAALADAHDFIMKLPDVGIPKIYKIASLAISTLLTFIFSFRVTKLYWESKVHKSRGDKSKE